MSYEEKIHETHHMLDTCIGIFQVFVGSSALTNSDSREKLCFKPIIEECTPDAVVCLMYESLIDGQFSSLWHSRSDFITDTFDWDCEYMVIKPKNEVILPAGKEDDLTRYDDVKIGVNEMELSSLNDRVDMRKWLQMSLKKRLMEGEQSQPAGEQSFLSPNIYLNQNQE
jgi:hypothetical protein